ncbi:MAG: hypothetical protein LBJ38_02345, partial [Oscillospiraceae bacterium]|nr:hypothetical protein [Oscillospiraceae bacterium]
MKLKLGGVYIFKRVIVILMLVGFCCTCNVQAFYTNAKAWLMGWEPYLDEREEQDPTYREGQRQKVTVELVVQGPETRDPQAPKTIAHLERMAHFDKIYDILRLLDVDLVDKDQIFCQTPGNSPRMVPFDLGKPRDAQTSETGEEAPLTLNSAVPEEIKITIIGEEGEGNEAQTWVRFTPVLPDGAIHVVAACRHDPALPASQHKEITGTDLGSLENVRDRVPGGWYANYGKFIIYVGEKKHP